MAEFEFKLKRNEEILITLPGADDGASVAAKKTPKGILRSKRTDDVLARRLRPDNAIFVRLIDVGQFADEQEIDFIYNANPALIVNPISSAYALNSQFAYAADFNSYILGFDRNNWSTTFREISNPYRYGFSVNSEISSEEKGDEGFEITPANFLQVSGGRAVQYFNTADTSRYKITSTPVFSAPETTFVLDKSSEVYLMPLIMRWTGRADRWRFPRDFSYPRYDYLLNGFYKAIPRTVLDFPSFETQFGMPFFRFSTVPNVASLPLYPYALRNDWKILNTLDPNAQLYEVRYNGAFSYRNHEANTLIAPVNFPTNETPDVYINPSGSIPTYRPYCWIYDNIMPGGLLCGAIKKENDWFFVWSRSDNSALSASGYLIAV